MRGRIRSCAAGLIATVLTMGLCSCGEKGTPSPGGGGDSGGSGKFCVSLGWLENESGQRQKRGFVDAGIPLFVADAIIAGVPATTSICSNDFGMGVWTLDYIAERLGGKGNIGVVDLPNNESWDLRGQGARFALEKYPEIKIVAQYSHDSEGTITPRQAIDNMLAAHGKGKLDAIWCAWDGAAQEGAQAIEAAGRAGEIITTGIDGGKHAFSIIKTGGPFKMTMAQSIYFMSYMSVVYAHKHLEGKQVPRFIISPVFAVGKEKLDKLPAPFQPEDYDIPGMAAKFGWKPVL